MNNSDQKPKVSTHEHSHFKIFEDAYQATDAPTFGLDEVGNIVFWNDAMLNLTDYYPEEAVGKHYSEFIEIFYYEDTFSIGGLLQNLTGKLKDRNGYELQVRTAGTPVSFDGVNHVYLSVQNITKEIVHVQELVKNNILMKELFSSSREMVVVFNRKGNISFASEPFKNLVNMTDPQLKRTTFINLIPNSHRTRLLIGLKMAEESQDEHKMELTIESESQKRITDCHISYKEDSKDCYRLHLFDITDKKRKELEQEVSYNFV